MSLRPMPVTQPADRGCGCGGGHGVDTGDVRQSNFVRPRFFAGQLLTEDDLELLTAYVTAKNRLHNRYLAGSGVVCGLEVVCDPYDGGKVRVLPGYALDCCGNDLVLACPQELDINAMIRDLRLTRLGKDCGDPCVEKDAKDSDRTKNDETPRTRRYCLYIRYAEEKTDPVAPYATEEPCGHQGCEPTRIREGVSFALECDKHELPPDDLLSRIMACWPDKKVIGRVSHLERYGEAMVAATANPPLPVAFGNKERQNLKDRTVVLAQLPEQPNAEETRTLVRHVGVLTAVLAAYDLQDQAPPADPKNLDVDGARTTLGQAASRLHDLDAKWDDELDRVAAAALLDQAEQIAAADKSLHSVPARMLVQGRPLDQKVLATVGQDTAALNDWLLGCLDHGTLADCGLRSEVAAVPVAEVAQAQVTDPSTVADVGRMAERLRVLLQRYLRDCICAALNPPCVPCDDTDVLLACLDVRDCEVVRICNAERQYVPSGSTLRYWIPSRLAKDFVDLLCCSGPQVQAGPTALVFRSTGFSVDIPAGDPFTLLGLDQEDLLRRARDVQDLVSKVAGSGDASAQVAALRDRVAALGRELSGLRNDLASRAELSVEKGRITKLQGRLSDLAAQVRPSGGGNDDE